MIEVGHVLFEHHPKLALAKDEEVVQALAAVRSKEPFAKRISLPCSIGRFEDGDACTDRNASEVLSEFAIVVAEQIARVLSKRSSFAQLLSDPGISGMPGHTDVNHPSRTEFNDEKGIQLTEGNVANRQKIARPDL